MRGEIVGVWGETWREIWAKLAKNSTYATELFSDLYRELVPEPKPPKEPPVPEELTDEGGLIRPEDIEARDAYERAFEVYEDERAKYEEAVSGGQAGRTALRTALNERIKTETDAVDALERAFTVVSSYDDEGFRNKYFRLVEKFLDKYSLRYDLRRPFSLHPTLPGMFAKLVREIRETTNRDANVSALLRDFEESIRDLKNDASTRNMKTCIQKQVNLLEAMGQLCPGVSTNTLGQICNEVGTWPHARLKEAMKNVYGFTCDYPGIRHAGNPAHSLREIEMRDLVAVCVMLAGFAPYLSNQIDSDTVYRG